MATLIRGRFTNRSRSSGYPLVVVRSDTGERIALDEQGRFAVRVDTGDVDTEDVDGEVPGPPREPVTLLLRHGPGRVSEVVLDPAAGDGEILIVTPSPTTDPRRRVQAAVERLAIDRSAREKARKALSKTIAVREVTDEKIESVVTAILDDIAGHQGGDLRWRLPHDFAQKPDLLKTLTGAAIDTAREELNAAAPVAHVKPGTLAANQTVKASELVELVVGSAELLRRPALETARLRRTVADGHGLPAPRPVATGTALDGAPIAVGSAQLVDVIDDKLTGLVDAMRLPEDPPLLQADSAVSGTGADVELAKGVADTVAFHDLHELALAMPSVWTDVFDRRFIGLLRDALKELVTAGVDVDPLAAISDGTAAHKLARQLRTVAEAYAETPVSALRSARPVSRPSALNMPGGLLGSGHGVVARRTSDELTPAPFGEFVPEEPVRPDDPPPETPFPDEEPPDPEPEEPDRGPMGLLEELESYMTGNHSFTVFPAHGAQRSLNFGVLLTWRQRWEPLSYQTGEIAHTTTLAPGERRKMVTRRVRKLKRYTSEAEKSMQSRRFETTETSRAETEILRKVDATTNFELTAEGSTKMLVENGSFSTTATRDVLKAGNDTRRRFREAVLKAAQEYRDEHAIEVRSEVEESFEEEVTSEVWNPNTELAVTGVFYTLQRRYQVSEHLYRARPVVMVAMPVPNPAQLTTAWLVRYAWILERSLLAERFRTALTYLTSSFLGDTEALAALETAVADQKSALAAAQERLGLARALLESRGAALRNVRQDIAEGRPAGFGDLPVISLVRDVYNFVGDLFGGEDDEAATRERNQMLLEAAEDELERAEREAREAESQLLGGTWIAG